MSPTDTRAQPSATGACQTARVLGGAVCETRVSQPEKLLKHVGYAPHAPVKSVRDRRSASKNWQTSSFARVQPRRVHGRSQCKVGHYSYNKNNSSLTSGRILSAEKQPCVGLAAGARCGYCSIMLKVWKSCLHMHHMSIFSQRASAKEGLNLEPFP